MAVLMDPETALPTKRKMTPSQIIMLLLYPVIFIVGLIVGLVIGLNQSDSNGTKTNTQNTNTPSTVIPNANSVVNTNTVDANVNVSNVFQNGNSALSGGDYLQLDAATQAELNQQEQAEKDRTIDQSLSVTDVVRQRDLITIKYRLKAYFAVNQSYPTTSGKQLKLDRTSNDILYQALKDFYGGSFNEPIDPQYPDYYYGYMSDGTSFELSAYLVSSSKAFILSDR